MRKFIVFKQDDVNSKRTMDQYKRISLVGLLCELGIDIGWWDKDTLADRLSDLNFHKDIEVEKTSIDYICGTHGYNGDGDHYWMIGEILPGGKFELLIS